MVKGITPLHEALFLLILAVAFFLLAVNLNLYPLEKFILICSVVLIFTIFFASIA